MNRASTKTPLRIIVQLCHVRTIDLYMIATFRLDAPALDLCGLAGRIDDLDNPVNLTVLCLAWVLLS